MKKLLTIFLTIFILIGLTACSSEKQEQVNNNETTETISEPFIENSEEVDGVEEEIYYLYEVCGNYKVNDILNNIPEMVNYGGGYPTIMWGDSYFGEYAQAFCEGFAKLQVKKASSVNIEDLTNTIEFYWGEDDIYNVYFSDDYIALVDNEAYQILDISYIEGILD